MKKLLQTSLVIVFLFGMVACGGSNTPEKTTEAFFQYVANKDFDKAIDLIYIKDLKDTEMASAKGKLNMLLAAASERMEKSGGFKSVKVTNTEVSSDGKTATVKYTMTVGDKESKASMNLIKVDGKWKILMK